MVRSRHEYVCSWRLHVAVRCSNLSMTTNVRLTAKRTAFRSLHPTAEPHKPVVVDHFNQASGNVKIGRCRGVNGRNSYLVVTATKRSGVKRTWRINE